VSGDARHCLVDDRADLEPKFWMPPLLGHLFVRHQVLTQFEALDAPAHGIARVATMIAFVDFPMLLHPTPHRYYSSSSVRLPMLDEQAEH
jgi:hypothetical protein